MASGEMYSTALNLSERSRRCLSKCILSRITAMISGMPILFIIFVNDMPEIVHNMICIFANDTKVFCHIKDDHDGDQLQDDLKAHKESSKD